MPKKKKIQVKEEKAPEQSRLDIACKALEKEYSVSLKWLDDMPEPAAPISSGSLSLDFALHNGGFFRGRVVEIYGPPGTGKSTLAISTIAEANKQGLSGLFIDAEHSLDKRLPIAYGVDKTKFAVVDDLYCGEDYLDAAEKLIKTGAFGVCVIDSINALVPKAELDGTIHNKHMGHHGKLMSASMRRFVPLLGETNTLLIFINQQRFKVGPYAGGPTTTGGEAIKYYASYRIEVKGGMSKDSKLFDPNTSEVCGHTMSFKVVKNKLGPPFREGQTDLYYGVGYDSIGELITLGSDLGVFEVSGSWYKYKGEQIGQGKGQVREFLKDNPDIRDELTSKLKDMLEIKVLNTIDVE